MTIAGTQIHLRELLPRLTLVGLFATGAILAFFESVYLRDQAREFADEREFSVEFPNAQPAPWKSIRAWKRVFRGVTLVLVASAIAIVVA